MKLVAGMPAIDFEAQQITGERFRLSEYRGSRILLSFFRNGACALCNLRVRELISNYHEFAESKIKIVAVFESPIEGMIPYVGHQRPPFVLISDPEGTIYSKYGVESSKEKVAYVIDNRVAEERIKQAAVEGFTLTQQEGSNFYRLPADFLIDANFNVEKVHYSNFVIDHLPIDELLNG